MCVCVQEEMSVVYLLDQGCLKAQNTYQGENVKVLYLSLYSKA